MTDQSVVVELADFNGFRLRYLKGPDLLFVLNDVAAALGYTSRDGLMFRVSKSDIERIQGTSRVMNAIKWSKLCDLLLITSNQKPEQSRSLRDFIAKNILPDAKRSEPGLAAPRKYKRKDKLFIEQFGGDIVGWRNGSIVTTSAIIASKTHCHHHDVMSEVFAHQSEIEQFGIILFDQELFITDNGLEQHKIAILNEKQAVMLLTFMHKMQFRKDLSRIFYVKSQEKHIEAPLAFSPVPTTPLVDVPASAVERSFDANRAAPPLSAAAPVTPVLAAGAVEQFMPGDNSLTMSSLKIVSLTGRQHKNVMADIRRILSAAGISPANFSAVYKDKQLIDRPCFNLPRRECDLVIERYPAKHRPAIIDAWQELERQATGVSVRHLRANGVTPALPAGSVDLRYSDNGLTMSSLEIADMTGKDHGDVLKDIRRILDEVGIDGGKFSGVYKGANGQNRPCFDLPRRECDLVVAGYSAKYRLAIIDRWQELERQATGVAGQPQFAIPQTLHEALQLASNLEKERSVAVEKLAISDEKLAVSDAKLAIAEPKAEALDVIANTEGLLGLQETGRVLDQPPNLFVKWLRDEVGGWIHKRSYLSKNMPFRGKVIDGYLVVKSTPVPDYRNGGEKM